MRPEEWVAEARKLLGKNGDDVSTAELAMLTCAGVRLVDIATGVERSWSARLHPLWPYIRTVAWNEAVRREEIRQELRAEAAG